LPTRRYRSRFESWPTPITPFSNAIRAIRPCKKVGRYRSVRVGLRYRALAVDVDGGYLWFWIGSHADYDKWIG
jgi:hypothetical protein